MFEIALTYKCLKTILKPYVLHNILCKKVFQWEQSAHIKFIKKVRCMFFK